MIQTAFHKITCNSGNNFRAHLVHNVSQRYTTGVSPTARLYADDTKLYREIENIPDDTHVLQSDLFRLIEWCKTWQLKFNPDKCKTMRITHKQDKSKESYTLDPNCEILKSVKNIKDLGITISYDLSWSDHIHEVVNKANKVLGVIKCVLGSNSVNEFSLLVMPTLEYAAPVWCPFLVKDIVLVEKVQRRASRLALGQKGAKWTTGNVVPFQNGHH